MLDDETFERDQDAIIYWRNLAKDLDTQLEDTKAALEEFQASSKDLEDELEKDLQDKEARHKQLTILIEQLQNDLGEWKAKHQATLRDHANTLSHMQKELESVRNSEQAFRKKIVDMELSNDDLEKSERALESTLQDVESRYGKSIERAALLEEELVAKARLEEENQRFKDELRDTLEELAIVKAELANRPHAPLRPLTPPGGTDLPSRVPGAVAETNTLRPDATKSENLPEATSSHSALTIATGTMDSDKLDVDATPRKASSNTNSTKSQPTRTSTSPILPSKRQSLIPSPRPSITPSTSMKSLSTSSSIQSISSLSSFPLESALPKRSTPRALREQRAQGIVSDLKTMGDRVKLLTAKVEARRQSFASSQNGLNSSIPISRPRRVSAQFTNTNVYGKNAYSTPTQNASTSRKSFRSIASPGSLEEELARASPTASKGTNLPKRPPSRASSVASSTSGRQTPSFRSPTPSFAVPSARSKISTPRPAFGSSSSSGRLPPLPTQQTLDYAQRERKSSNATPISNAKRHSIQKLPSHLSSQDDPEERF